MAQPVIQPTTRPNPNTIEVDGVGRVQVSDDFFQLSPELQEQAVGEIIQYHRDNAPAAPQAAPADDRQIPDAMYRMAPIASTALEGARDTAVGAVEGAAHFVDQAADLLGSGYNATLGRAFGQAGEPGDPATSNLAQQAPEGGNAAGRFIGEMGTAALLTRGMGPIAQGASTGAVLSEADSPGRFALDVVAGGAGGKLGDVASRAASSVIAPRVSDAVRRLHDRGVRMTPGQASPALRRTEERLTSRPFVGDRIVEGRRQSVRDFNRVALEDTLAPIGVRLPPDLEGHAAIRFAGDQLSDRYERLIPTLQLMPDQQLATDIRALGTTLASGDMSPAALSRFEQIVRNQIMSRLNVGGAIDGPTYRQIERNLGRQIRRYSRSDAPDDQAMAEAFEQIQTAFQGALQRSNPASAAELQALNSGWANLVRVEGAAGGAKGGIFSPLQLRQAVRRGDSRTRGRGMARGEARMQQLAEDASDVLPSSYPDSGTAGRQQMNPLDPRYWIGMGQGALYGQPTQQAITNALLAPRPAFARSFADTLNLLPAAPAGGAIAVTGGNALFGF